jgi:hypothetical protein
MRDEKREIADASASVGTHPRSETIKHNPTKGLAGKKGYIAAA